MSPKSVFPRVSPRSVFPRGSFQECHAKSAPQECHVRSVFPRVSPRSVFQRVSCQECLPIVSPKSVSQECLSKSVMSGVSGRLCEHSGSWASSCFSVVNPANSGISPLGKAQKLQSLVIVCHLEKKVFFLFEPIELEALSFPWSRDQKLKIYIFGSNQRIHGSRFRSSIFRPNARITLDAMMTLVWRLNRSIRMFHAAKMLQAE